MRSMWWRRAAAVVAVTLLAAACGGGEEAEPSEAASAPAAESEPMTSEAASSAASEAVEVTGKGDGTLTLGTVLPESGQLAFLGAPMIFGVQQAVEDINAAGGFMDSDVVLETGDSGTDPTVARPTVNRLLGSGADAIIGAAASGVSQEIIQTLYDNEIAQCSPANTSPAFSEQENAGFYFRTVPPDEAVTPVIVDTVIADGFSNVAVVARADDYGNALADLVEAGLQEANANVAVKTTYDPNTTGFDAQVQEVQNSNADAVVVIAFNEGAAFIRQLVEGGFDPAGLYGSDGIFAPSLPEDVGGDDDFIDGMTVIGASGSTEFNQDVLNPILPDDEKGNFIYGAQAYDCAVVMALAANAAESDDAAVFAEEIVNVTTGGTQCTSYEECLGMVQEGEDIDYNGAAGPIELEGNEFILGDPQVGRYAVATFENGGQLVQRDEQDIDLAELGN